MTSAMSGLAIQGMCMVMRRWGSWGRSGRDVGRREREKLKGTGLEGRAGSAGGEG